MNYPSTSHTMKVPGATLYYEVRGSGPVLLMIPGGPADAGVFSGLAGCIADRHTVVAYDPRGNSRSIFDGAPEKQQLDVHGDDAARLIETVGTGPAYVLGSSGGAQIGLNLAARHPARVRTLVAHEPPCIQMLPDASQVLTATQEVYDTYLRDGVRPAMQKFMQMAGLGGPPPQAAPPLPEAQAAFARFQGNMDYFLAHGLWPISMFVPDVATLRAGPVRVVVGVGESTKGQIAYRTAVALAQKLGTERATFPGDHNGFGARPESFAATLHRVLRGT
ncbi:MAG: alpha/beta fold hydrolase [Candidatus Binatus sp.]|uniref:alpha/beta fold hydrolase n=1 Tax=Candidatus Binatus sp. TaxID=2811406 RepID=UPI0027216AAD|nr:alpha/beta fold hydrolase [Candidatus Binatus sp.]MDO8431331.1 alpha/beta fold hydrolase [Candidatus Binatus sp.]